jgi:kynurenine 3-monooxygenase
MSSAMRSPVKGSLTIIGAGLAGSLLGIFMARRGFRPELYERRQDMRRATISAGRSINLALADRGIHALERAGVIDKVRPLMIPMRGRMLHVNDTTSLLRYGQDDREVIYSVSRAELNRRLMTEVENITGGSIRFQQVCRGADFAARRLRMFDETAGREYRLEGGPFIATDGASSAVRDAMVTVGLAKATEDVLPHKYKELVIPAGPDGSHRLDPNALHIWPRGGFMLIALANIEGSFTVTLFLPAEGPESFATLTDPERVTAFFERHFPDAVPLLPTLAEDFFGNPTGSMITVHCTPWHVDGQAVLLGDAAHAIVPFHGQGMNCAFEDCVTFDTLLERQADWPELFAEFERQRRPNAQAISRMAIENYVEMRDSVRSPKFQLQKTLSLELERRFPGRFIPRYSMVMFHHEIAYATAFERGKVQQRILDELTTSAETIEQVDMERARQLVTTQLNAL